MRSNNKSKTFQPISVPHSGSRVHGTTSLHYAAEHSNSEIVESLIQNGDDVNIADSEGLSPLHFAALNDDEKVIQKLIEHKGDINKVDKKGYTPLHMAALNSNEKVITNYLEMR